MEYKGFQITGECDKEVVDSVYEKDQYKIRTLPHETGLMIDIGAHIGTFSRLWRDVHPDAKIVSVEPDINKFSCLSVNAGNFATAVNAMVTYLPWSHDDLPSLTLEGILGFTGKKYISCLKLDCEGYEYDILENAAQTTLDRCQLIVGEWHGWIPDRFISIVKRRFPNCFFTWEPCGIGNFVIYNPYWTWRVKCNA